MKQRPRFGCSWLTPQTNIPITLVGVPGGPSQGAILLDLQDHLASARWGHRVVMHAACKVKGDGHLECSTAQDLEILFQESHNCLLAIFVLNATMRFRRLLHSQEDSKQPNRCDCRPGQAPRWVWGILGQVVLLAPKNAACKVQVLHVCFPAGQHVVDPLYFFGSWKLAASVSRPRAFTTEVSPHMIRLPSDRSL